MQMLVRIVFFISPHREFEGEDHKTNRELITWGRKEKDGLPYVEIKDI